MKKRILTVFLTICLCTVLLPISSSAIATKTMSQVKAWLDNECENMIQHGNGQCVFFLKDYQVDFWGTTWGTSGNTGLAKDWLCPAGFSEIDLQGNAENFRMGDVIVEDWGDGVGHVAIYYGVEYYEPIRGYCHWVVDQNSANGTVQYPAKHAWTTAMSCSTRCYRPPIGGQSTYVNLGDDFYAYIIMQNGWCHLENGSQNLQVAKNGNDCSDPKQIWHFIRMTDKNAYKIISEYDGTCLDAANFGTANGTNVGTWASNDSTAQRWYITANGSGYALSPSYSTGLVIDVVDGYTAGGTNAQLWERVSGISAQVFSIYPLSNNGVDYASMKPSAPAKPSPLSVTNSNGTINIAWAASPVKNQFDSRTYRVDVFSGSSASGTPVFSKAGLTTTSCTTTLGLGTYTFRVRAINTKYINLYSETSTTFTVLQQPTSLLLSPDPLIIGLGETATITATIFPVEAADSPVFWYCDDTAVATVSGGVVTAVGRGTATISARAGEIIATCAVTVKDGKIVMTGSKPKTLSDGKKVLNWQTVSNRLEAVSCTFVLEILEDTGKMESCRLISAELEPGENQHQVELSDYDDSTVFKVFCLDSCFTPIAESITVYAKTVLSDWMLASDAPEGAEVVEEKWTYDRIDGTTTSASSTLDGWESTGYYWDKTGSGTYNYASYPAGFDTGHALYSKYGKSALTASTTATTKRTVTSATQASYIYWHWTCNMYEQASGNYNIFISDEYAIEDGLEYYNFRAFESSTSYGQTDPNGRGPFDGVYYAWFSNPQDGSWWWFRFPVYKQTYKDYQKMYTYAKVTHGLESPTEIAESNTVVNVQHWVRYVVQ